MIQDVNLLLALPVRIKAKFPVRLLVRIIIIFIVLLLLASIGQYAYNFALQKDFTKANQAKGKVFNSLVVMQKQLSPNNKSLQKEKVNANVLLRAVANKKQLLVILQEKEKLNTQGFSRYLNALAQYTPTDAWLTELELQNGGSKLIITGQSISSVSVLNLIANLDQDKLFDGKRFNLVSLNKLDSGEAKINNQQVFTFEVEDE